MLYCYNSREFLNPNTRLKVRASCGHCMCCLRRRALEMSFRFSREYYYNRKSNPKWKVYRFDLTYAPEHVPQSICGVMTLCERDVQLFLKRLRKNSNAKIRFVYGAEYSPVKKRPHYHFVVQTDLSLMDLREMLELSWRLGFVEKTEEVVCVSSCVNYALKYAVKGVGDDNYPYEVYEMVLPYVRSSVNLGDAYFKENRDRFVKLGYFPDGDKKIPLTRFFIRKYMTREEKEVFMKRLYEQDDALRKFLCTKKDIGGSPRKVQKEITEYKLRVNRYSGDISRLRGMLGKALGEDVKQIYAGLNIEDLRACLGRPEIKVPQVTVIGKGTKKNPFQIVDSSFTLEEKDEDNWNDILLQYGHAELYARLRFNGLLTYLAYSTEDGPEVIPLGDDVTSLVRSLKEQRQWFVDRVERVWQLMDIIAEFDRWTVAEGRKQQKRMLENEKRKQETWKSHRVAISVPVETIDGTRCSDVEADRRLRLYRLSKRKARSKKD